MVRGYGRAVVWRGVLGRGYRDYNKKITTVKGAITITRIKRNLSKKLEQATTYLVNIVIALAAVVPTAGPSARKVHGIKLLASYVIVQTHEVSASEKGFKA